MRFAKVDFGYVIILLIIASVSTWLISMPFCKFIQRATMDRFHLQTESFWVWCVEQPIPAMYNLYNRYEIRPSPWKPEPDGVWEAGTLNHFPLRLFTFGDNRVIFLRPKERRQIDLWSSYRGEALHTQWIAEPSSDGGFDLSGVVVP
jgi:hypothetical protein